MAHVVIRVEQLSKAYQIGAARVRHDTLRDQIAGTVSRFLQTKNRPGCANKTIWALRDVSFMVNRGEVVGIIGRNGAGKSTLLKILSRITEPTDGYAEVHGRMGSLLEVGTGFHPELTGRENIYLNGTILGMKKAEIARKFDEIVAFAETAEFIDTPVKRYSSGMYVRLAFAVAAHLEPELLMVDEVLSVGDIEFQKKCLGRMRDISQREGRTILFVSHNLDAIQRLCSKCLMIEQGKVVAAGETPLVLARYLANQARACRPGDWVELRSMRHSGTGDARFVAARFCGLHEGGTCEPYAGGPVEFLLAIESDSARSVGSLAVTFYSSAGTKLINADTIGLDQAVRLRKGRTLVRLIIKKLHLNPGVYLVGLWLANPIGSTFTGGEYDHIQPAFEIHVGQAPGGRRMMPRESDGFVPCEFEITAAD